MIKLQKSSLILILIIVVLTAGCVSIYTLSYTNGAVWHKAEDVKAGTFGNYVGKGDYTFPANLEVGTGQVTAGTKFKVGSSELSSSSLKVNNDSLIVTEDGMYVKGGSGDVNGDGVVNIADASNIALWVAGEKTFTKEQYARADINGDGIVNSLDANLIANYTVGIITLDQARNEVGKRAAANVIHTTYDGRVGIGTANPQAKLEVSGNVKISGVLNMNSQKIINLANPTESSDAVTKEYLELFVTQKISEEAPAAKLYFMEGSNPTCPSTTFLVGKRCSDGAWRSSTTSCNYDAAMCAGPDPENMLFSLKHSVTDCQALPNGSVQVESGTLRKFCKISGASQCPSGWTQYKNWSTTTPPSSCGCYCNGSGCCRDGTYWASYLVSGICGSHAWSNTSLEVAIYGAQGCCDCLWYDCCQCEVRATITEIGCY